FDISGTIPFHRPTKWVQYMGDYITFGAFFFLPQHNGKTQSCSEAKASSAAKNHNPRRRKIHYLSVYISFYDYWMMRHFAYQCAGKVLHDALKGSGEEVPGMEAQVVLNK
ncbi:MAG: hypothetical protein ACLROR_11155, partial [Klebsiella michiganensis]